MGMYTHASVCVHFSILLQYAGDTLHLQFSAYLCTLAQQAETLRQHVLQAVTATGQVKTVCKGEQPKRGRLF